MNLNWLKRISERFSKKLSALIKPKVRGLEIKDKGLVIREREPTRDELALGYVRGIDEETDEPVYQLKGIPQKDRARHFYVIGATGTGKTKFLEYLIKQDLENGFGFGVIDPHGDLIEDIKGLILFTLMDPQDRRSQVVLIEPTNPETTVSFNPLERIEGVSPEEQAAEVVEIFQKIWGEFWGPRMEDILRNSLIALIENNLTLAELPLLLTDELMRKRILKKVKNPECLRCFEDYARIKPSVWREWIESTLNKVHALLSDRRMRHIFALPKSSFSLRDVIDNQKILLVKLEKGRLKGNADLLGSLLLSEIQMAAFARTDIPEEKRVPFYLYIDEFQNFATKTFINVLSEARKYKLYLILAHQNLAQIPKELRASILANCGIQVCFQVSREDAQIMAKELMTPLYRQPPGWEISVQTLQELEPRQCFIKNKAEGGIVPIVETKPMPAPWKISAMAPGGLDGTTPETFKKSVEEAEIGADYLIDRKKIEREYKKRYKKLTNVPEPKTFREPKR